VRFTLPNNVLEAIGHPVWPAPDREGVLPVRHSRGEGCDSAAGLAKSDPRAPQIRSRSQGVFSSFTREGSRLRERSRGRGTGTRSLPALGPAAASRFTQAESRPLLPRIPHPDVRRLEVIGDKLFVREWLPVLKRSGDRTFNMGPNRWNLAVCRMNPDPEQRSIS
jgi:hypothetical protein